MDSNSGNLSIDEASRDVAVARYTLTESVLVSCTEQEQRKKFLSHLM